MPPRVLALSLLLAVPAALCGCGTTKQTTATEQLLGADAVDRAVARIDFTPFAGQKVYFNTEYIKNYPGKTYQGIGYVNSEYVISSLRQQMITAGCLLFDKVEEADYVIEARIGTLGHDANEVVYGLPANNALSAASAALPGAPPLPTIPEISVARKSDKMAAVKVAAFAYDRQSRRPVWQSGLSLARSTSRDTWFMGVGPFKRGSIHDGVEFAGTRLPVLSLGRRRAPDSESAEMTAYADPVLYERPKPPAVAAAEAQLAAGEKKSAEGTPPESGVKQASAQAPAK